MKLPTETEDSVESAITALLQCHGWLVIKINAERPNKGKPQKRQAEAGTPDLVALKGGRGVLIECKRPTGLRRRSQEQFAYYAQLHGVPVILARGIEDIRELIGNG